MMDGMDIAAFLRARLDEDEAVAQEASDRETHGFWYVVESEAPEFRAVANGADTIADDLHQQDASHIARWNPARVLADIAARRILITIYEETVREERSTLDLSLASVMRIQGAAHALDLRVLAQPYAGHEDFRPEWRM